MKKLIGISILALFLAWAPSVNAQEEKKDSKVEKGAKKAGKGVEEGAEAVGKKSAEVGSKTKAKATDQVYKNKVGPDGQTVYIDPNSKYYWIDKKGKKHYVTEAQLKNKPPKD